MFPADPEATKQILGLFAEIAERCLLTPVQSDDYDSMQRHTPGTAYPPSRHRAFASTAPAFSWTFAKPQRVSFKTATIWFAIPKSEILCVLRAPPSTVRDNYGEPYPGTIETVLKLWSPGWMSG